MTPQASQNTLHSKTEINSLPEKNIISEKLEHNKNKINKDQASPNYLAQYGLRESAFSQEIDDKFFFLDTDQAQRLNFLHNLIQDPNLFLHLSGVSGVGKTSLINRFINIGEEDWRFSLFSANAMMNSEQLFFNVSAGFGLSGIPDNNKNLKETCLSNISMLEKSGVVPILIVDDVQELPIDTLKSIFELVNRWDKNQPKLRIILVSDTKFESVLQSSEVKPLSNVISHVMELEPLVEEQIGRYIYFRLSVAGLDGGNPINPEACSVILEKSKGIPEKINSLCHIALRDGMDEMTMKEFFDDHNFDFPFRKYLITAAIMAIFLGVVFSVMEPYNFKLSQKVTIQNNKELNSAISSSSMLGHLTDKKIIAENKSINFTNNKTIELITSTKTDIIKNKEINTQEIKSRSVKIYNFDQLLLNLVDDLTHKNSNAIFSIIKIQFKNNSISSNDSQKKGSAELLKKKIKIVSKDTKKYDIKTLTTIKSKNFPTIKSISRLKPISDEAEETISIFGLRFTQKSNIAIYGIAGKKAIDASKITYISETQLNVLINSKEFPGKNWIVVTDPENGKSNSKLFEISNSVKIKLAKPEIRFIQDTAWILSQESHLYILHILGSKLKEELVKLAHSEKMNGQYALFETNKNGVQWYHLILGTYENREAAKTAIHNFPQQLKKPWIRPIKDIQTVIKRLNQKAL